jgi:hypothetical protein
LFILVGSAFRDGQQLTASYTSTGDVVVDENCAADVGQYNIAISGSSPSSDIRVSNAFCFVDSSRTADTLVNDPSVFSFTTDGGTKSTDAICSNISPRDIPLNAPVPVYFKVEAEAQLDEETGQETEEFPQLETSNVVLYNSVTFVDSIFPTFASSLTDSGSLSLSADPTSCTALLTYSISASDNCNIAMFSRINGPESGAYLPVGEYLIQYQAIDLSGNSAQFSSCKFIQHNVFVPDSTLVFLQVNIFLSLICQLSMLLTMNPR